MKRFQVAGIGNAMVDVLAPTPDDFLARHGIQKGIMQLIDQERAVALYDALGPTRQISGGSAANTIAGLAHMGARTTYVGKVRDDQLGAIFAHDLRAQGAVFDTPLAPATTEQETGRCLVCVTADGERSMNTYLGVSEFLGPDDIDPGAMADADWLYLEGYRFDGPDSKEAFAKAIAATKQGGGRVSVTLSDPFCVERHRAAFRALVRDDVDLLFANRAEMISLYQTDDLDAALDQAAAEAAIVACTDGANGAHILTGGERWHVPAEPTTVVDATGAGDLFAAGFLWGLVNGRTPAECGRMGCLAAAEVISHIGARPEVDLRDIYRAQGL
ncbi:adenosine kinase [Falsirhodobacter halotolerans]|uniref:adenosine kinase n=1 Tax=Falsirhodobacter halotolerans TaxID=1146892 RepID=UPI001FD4DC4A|nr:adenosine kinase [Falsirhodobacter halotolerans]MCJ8138790.1 adenosine kinase [Falsirhodobacter halotolerans]